MFTVWLGLTAVAMLSAVWSCDYRTAAAIYAQLRVYWRGRERQIVGGQREREGGRTEGRRKLKMKRESKEGVKLLFDYTVEDVYYLCACLHACLRLHGNRNAITVVTGARNCQI